MFSGLKFIPRDHIGSAQDENITDSGKKKHKSSDSSSNDEEAGRIKKKSRRKKWYSSDEYSSSYSSDSGSEQDTRVSRSRRRGKKKKKHNSRSEDKDKGNSKRSRRKDYSSGDSFDGEDRKDHRKKGSGRSNKELEEDKDGDDGESDSLHGKNIMRKEMGLEWMLRPKNDAERMISVSTPDEPEEPPKEEVKKINPRELNPYFKDDGSGFPEDADGHIAGSSNLLSTSVVGDGGASWRLKALKRAQEQAAREGRKLDEVVEERWGSLGQLAVSVASRSAAPSRAHIGAIKSRIRRQTEEQQAVQGNHHDTDRESMNEESIQHPKMRVPKVHDSLSWEKRKSQSMSVKDAGLISSAMASLNKFSNDGSFMSKFLSQQNDDSARNREEVSVSLESERLQKSDANVRPALGANQLAAKVLQLRMKGKHEEADKLLKEAEECKDENNVGTHPSMTARQGTTSRYLMQTTNMWQKKKEEDADIHLAQTIVKNKQYKVSAQADDEYDYEGDPVKKKKKKAAIDPKSTVKNSFTQRILTQQERCNFCFENPTRPRHLVVSIANATYLMLPMSPPVVAGHCYILPVQHESATRSVDNSVWDEIRNFKKCLIMMFAKQEKDVIFLETAMGYTKQRRHCLVECIPLPQEIARQGPLYFKKAIDEAEEEWSQHNAKKLIDTSEKGLRGSIPKDFPYFHVEFGLKKGFVHVIDDESQFKSNFGINVIRGMLRLPAEDMHRRQRHDSLETQKQAVASFARDWEPFDWTKQLD